MDVHHLFVVSDTQHIPADKLVQLGFAEGSSRVHTGQGTCNRKFYFHNFYLEVLWCNNAEEVNSLPVVQCGLHDRINFRKTGYSRFGLCLEHDADSDMWFQDAHMYFPAYFPSDWGIAFRHSAAHKSWPWFFRLPFKERYMAIEEPIDHVNGVKQLTKITFTINESDYSPIDICNNKNGILQFEIGEQPHMLLEFDGGINHRTEVLEELGITLRW